MIVPGADGNMWFTENGSPGKIGVDQPGHAHDHTEFPTPTADSRPGRDRPGLGREPVVHRERRRGKVGVVGAGAPAAVLNAPAVTGTAQPGQTLTCQAATWSDWAGQQPTFGFGFDGFRWLLDGSPISGATAQTLAIPAADAGHKISCEELATYPLLDDHRDVNERAGHGVPVAGRLAADPPRRRQPPSR